MEGHGPMMDHWKWSPFFSFIRYQSDNILSSTQFGVELRPCAGSANNIFDELGLQHQRKKSEFHYFTNAEVRLLLVETWQIRIPVKSKNVWCRIVIQKKRLQNNMLSLWLMFAKLGEKWWSIDETRGLFPKCDYIPLFRSKRFVEECGKLKTYRDCIAKRKQRRVEDDRGG